MQYNRNEGSVNTIWKKYKANVLASIYFEKFCTCIVFLTAEEVATEQSEEQ